MLSTSTLAHAYSDKVESCIDRINGVLLKRFSSEARGLLFALDSVDNDIVQFCQANDSEYNYSDLTVFGEMGQDNVDNFFMDYLYGKYIIIGKVNGAFKFDTYDLQIKDTIQEELEDTFVQDSKKKWQELLAKGLSDGFVYYQDYIDAVDRIYGEFEGFQKIVQTGLDKDYVCKDGLYTNVSDKNCSCLDGYTWNTFQTSCVETHEPVLNETDNSNFTQPEETMANTTIEIPFEDITELHKNLTAILYLKDSGIINGYPDGTFKPEKSVNRAELLKIIIEGKGFTPSSAEYNKCFKDIIDTEWYAPYVCYAKSVNWISGYPDGTFKPSRTVNKAEAIKMLLNSQGVEIPTDITVESYEDVDIKEWFAPYINKAKELGILEEDGNKFEPAKEMTRGGISENLYRLLTIE